MGTEEEDDEEREGGGEDEMTLDETTLETLEVHFPQSAHITCIMFN